MTSTKTISLTYRRVEQITPPAEGRDIYHDAQTRGLYLVVSKTGRKTWEYVRKVHGRVCRMKVGDFPALTVEDARKGALAMAALVSAGKDPAADRRRVKAEATLGEVFATYLMHAQGRNRSWPTKQDQYDRFLAPWKTRKMSSLTRGDVAALHARVGKENGPYAANRLMALVSSVWNYARNDLEMAVDNPARGIERFPEQSRDRFLRADELQRFLAACKADPEPWGDFFQVLLLTGARKANVMAMRWCDIELERGLWKIPGEQSKNGEPLVVVLVPAALEILRRRHEARLEDKAFVFPSRGTTGHLAHTAKAWERLTAAAGLEDVRVHDLRRTLGSWATLTGASLSIVGKMLGHASLAATKVYARLDVEGTRQAAQTAADAMLQAAANGKTPTLPSPENGKQADSQVGQNKDGAVEAAMEALLAGLDDQARVRLLERLQKQNDE